MARRRERRTPALQPPRHSIRGHRCASLGVNVVVPICRPHLPRQTKHQISIETEPLFILRVVPRSLADAGPGARHHVNGRHPKPLQKQS
jgi:hypothetical protein